VSHLISFSKEKTDFPHPPMTPPRLIIYRTERYNTVYQTSIKYGIATNRINSMFRPDLKRNQLSMTKRFGKRNIEEIVCNFSALRFNNLHTIKLAYKNSGLRKFHLTLDEDIVQYQHSLNITKFLRKIFKHCKRITTLKIIMKSEGKVPYMLYNSLSLLNSLEYIKLHIRTFEESTITALNSFLKTMYKRRNWFPLKYQAISFDLAPMMANEEYSTNSLSVITRCLQSLGNTTEKIKTNLELLFYFAQIPETPELLEICAALKDIPNLTRLAMGTHLEIDFQRLTNSIKNKTRLASLNYYIAEEKTSKALTDLPFSLSKIKSLESLEVWSDAIENITYLKQFARSIFLMSQIKILNLVFYKGNPIDDETLILFADSLSKMTNLRNLTIKCRRQSPLNTISVNGFNHMFESFKNLNNLRYLSLDLSGHEECISDSLFETLCKSLFSLKNLDFLGLNFASNKIGDKAVFELGKTLPELKNLETLFLDLDGSDPLSTRTVGRLFSGLNSLKRLSSLTLRLMCLWIDNFISSTIISTLNGLKCLNSLELCLYRSAISYDHDIYKFLDVVLKFRKRMKFNIYCPLHFR